MKAYLKTIKEISSHTGLLKELVSRDLKVKYRSSVLGIVWSVLNPFLMMVVMTIIFSGMFSTDIEFYPVYYMSGFMIFTLNSETSNDGMYSIIGNAALLKKVFVPKILFPLSKAILAIVNCLFTFCALILIALCIGAPITWTVLLLPFVVITTAMFSTGLGLILCSFCVKFRDICYIYSVVLYAWMFATPLFYPASSLVGLGEKVMKFNPLYYFVEYSRNIILYGKIPSLEMHVMCVLFAVSFLLVGIKIFQEKQNKFIFHV